MPSCGRSVLAIGMSKHIVTQPASCCYAAAPDHDSPLSSAPMTSPASQPAKRAVHQPTGQPPLRH